MARQIRNPNQPDSGQQRSEDKRRNLNDLRYPDQYNYTNQHDYSRESYYGQHFQNVRRNDARPGFRSYNNPKWIVPGPFRGLGPKGYQRSDERIHEDICERLTWHGEIDISAVDVAVQDGIVILRGDVRSHYAKRVADQVAEMIVGVRDVQNELRVVGSERIGIQEAGGPGR